MATTFRSARLSGGQHWASRRFERKHSGLHQGLAVALPLSIFMWAAIIVLARLF